MNARMNFKVAAPLAVLAAFAACSGGGGGSDQPQPPPTATSLVYTNPTSGAYQLVRDAGKSTATHLVLDLIGPAGTSGRGVGFFLNADNSRVTWSKVDLGDAEYAQNGAFSLGSGVQALKSKINGNELQAGIYQKGLTVPAVAFGSSVVLGRVALDLKTGLAPGAVSISAVSNKAMLLPDSGTAAPGNISLTVGTLTTQ